MAITSRNTDVSPHIGKLSRSALYSKKGLYKRAYPSAAAPSTDAPLTKSVPIKGAKNGSTRTIPTTKAPAFYPSEDVKRMKISRKTLRPTKLRASITPGTVLIMLAGRFRGKRVVCLGQLQGSGLLLISGPYKINGVPLRRVNQAYVIATSTKIDISALTVDPKFNDAYFSKDKSASRNGTEAEFFKADGSARVSKPVVESRAADQKSVDKVLLAAIAQTPNLKSYLNATFGLSKGQHPHLMKF